ncbi:hypothetical protein BGX33_005576 [Mortierella sp. NVP41]|nr:hypothetical protein BGX33_005576 [Mortierella sp. NVP41]
MATTESLASDITPGSTTPTTATTTTTTTTGSIHEQQHEDNNDQKKSSEHEKHEEVNSTVQVPQADLDAELTVCKERLEAIEKDEGRTGADPEKIALEELEKTTQILISVRKELTTKQEQLDDEAEGATRDKLKEEIRVLSKESSEKERQWSATKEVYHREFGPIVEDTSKPVTGVKAKAALDIKMLQEQIASLQKQLDAVSLKRKEMAADAEEQHKRLAEQNHIDEDDE